MPTEAHTLVMQRGPAQFTAWGGSLGRPLHDTDELIAPGMAKRLIRYANARLAAAGFGFAGAWPVSVEALDAEDAPADRVYSVTWTNTSGSAITLNGILISRHGHPVVDHGLSIEEDVAGTLGTAQSEVGHG